MDRSLSEMVSILLQLQDYDPTVKLEITSGFSPVCMCIEQVNVGDNSYLLSVCGAGDDFETALRNLFGKLANLDEDAYVVIRSKEGLVGLRLLDSAWVQIRKYT